MSKIKLSAAIPAIRRVGGAVLNVLEGGGRAGQIDPSTRHGSALHGLVGRLLDRVDMRNAFGGGGIAFMGDDHPSRLTVCRQEQFQAALEIWVVKSLRRQIEGVVVLGGVKGLSHGGSVFDQGRRLGIDPGHGGVVSQRQFPIDLLAGDLVW